MRVDELNDAGYWDLALQTGGGGGGGGSLRGPFFLGLTRDLSTVYGLWAKERVSWQVPEASELCGNTREWTLYACTLSRSNFYDWHPPGSHLKPHKTVLGYYLQALLFLIGLVRAPKSRVTALPLYCFTVRAKPKGMLRFSAFEIWCVHEYSAVIYIDTSKSNAILT